MKPPFNNQFFQDQFKDDFIDNIDPEDIKHKRKIAGIMLQDLMNRQSGNVVAPDTTGVGFEFLMGFITPEMSCDFALIEQDFLKNCRSKLEEFRKAGWYGAMSFRTHKPLDAIQNSILCLIYNGAKLGDEYCIELIKNLYKVYHKKEYNQLKRFRTINAQEILSLSEDEIIGDSYPTMGRIVAMCQFLGIELHENCSFIYKLLNNDREEFLAMEDEETEFLQFEEGLFDECTEQINEWVEELKKKNIPRRKKIKNYLDTIDFIGLCMRQHGYVDVYPRLCLENDMGVKMQMIRTLAMLRTWKPKKEFTFEEVQFYTNIYDLAAALADTADCLNYDVGYLIGDEIDELDIEDALFNPANMTVNVKNRKPEKKPVTNVAPVSKGDVTAEDYLAEIAELRKKLNEKEQENKYLREMYRSAKHSSEETEGLVKKYEAERDELIALREYAYNSEHENDDVEEDKLPDMEKAIADKKIVIIGGHVNWQNKLKQLFPEWLIVHLDEYKTVNSRMLEGKEKVYFFTDYINHISYKKFIAIVREKNIPFGYIGSSNIGSVVAQIYEEMVK
ncbi:hypothetical protein SAMN05216349_10632 [Oribacterium sp. KHPX15]|uniref:DUF2325 domain-containing protein n=1 Tax=Oribacterium sp. KHPX15 TaxID=1855342 RepID=UPI000899301D|nr:DUF2325 domain-containing protein [Oribacterium sp. KHPX15]SEA17694.1 hypothetical protein SAMN05216349_10632 [Oribacterium sp. KHPX15]